MALSKEEKNARKRQRRLTLRKEKVSGKHCLNCDILIAARLEEKSRSYLYCRKCITEYKVEARRHRWRRYYHSKLKQGKVAAPAPLLQKKKEKRRTYTVSWRTLKTI